MAATEEIVERPAVLRQTLPRGACDAHCHIFGPGDRFPYAEGRSYTPDDAPYEKISALHAHLGIERAVLVQANCHGNDHRAILDALRRSEGRYRAVALLSGDESDGAVEELHRAGFRGVRFNYVPHLGRPPETKRVERIIGQVGQFGWHVLLHIDAAGLRQFPLDLGRFEVPFVIDHMGRIKAADGADQQGMKEMLALRDNPQAWIKVSGIDRISRGKRPFRDGLPFVSSLVESMPDRILWGTDWPHPNISSDYPDEGELVGLLHEAVPDAGIRRKVLVENPAALYDFPEVPNA